MSQNHTVDLHPDEDDMQAYETNDDNLANIKVLLNGEVKPIDDTKVCVVLDLSITALIGLGTELLRKGLAAQNGETPYFNEEPIDPIFDNSHLLRNGFAIFLIPGSADLIIRLRDLGKLDDFI